MGLIFPNYERMCYYPGGVIGTTPVSNTGSGLVTTTSPLIVIPDDTDGTYTISQAVSSVLLIRGNIPDPNYDFSTSLHKWTPANPFLPGEEVLFVYNQKNV